MQPARAILHVDMDAFYASVEELDRPELRGKPVVVGGASRRGVVAAASYAARASGVRSAMSTALALARCPDAVVIPPRHARYAEVSRGVFEIFSRYTPQIEALSIDEAFLDVTASLGLFGGPEAIARAIKAAIAGELGLGASAGVASNKFVAKVASDLEKPDGLVVVPPGQERVFLAPLGVERLWGVGPKAAERLRGAGITTIGQVASAEGELLESLLGASAGRAAAGLARGKDERPVCPDREAESIGAEETFERDLEGEEAVQVALLALCERVALRLVEGELVGCRTVTLKIRYSDFSTLTRRTTLPAPIASTLELHGIAKALLARVPLEGRRIRLVGVSASSLREPEKPAQIPLFAEPQAGADPARGRALEEVLLRTRERFGASSIVRASLLGSGEGRGDDGKQDPPRSGGRDGGSRTERGGKIP